MMWAIFVLVLITVFAESATNDISIKQHLKTKHGKKRFYICPPDFIRFGHKCYYLSEDTATWNQAYFKCQEKFGFLASFDSYTEDKSIRALLNQQRKSHDNNNGFWIGGIYDWGKMQWQWTGKKNNLTFNGFHNSTRKITNLAWHCILMDHKLHFKWIPHNCIETQKFICETALQRVNRKQRKLLKMKYNKSLNEILVPASTMLKIRKRPKVRKVLEEFRTMDDGKEPFYVLRKKKGNKRPNRKTKKNNETKRRITLKHKTVTIRDNSTTIRNRNPLRDISLYPNLIVDEYNFH